MSQSRSSGRPWDCPGDLLEDLASRYIAVRAEPSPDGHSIRVVVSDSLDQLTEQDIAALAYWGPEIVAIVEEWHPATDEPPVWIAIRKKRTVAWSWNGATH